MMSKTDLENKRIAVIGAGGVGGYMAGMLGKVFPHLTLAVRDKRLESIRKSGLHLHSDYHGEIIIMPENAAPAAEIGEQDYIFVCVKNYSLEEVCRSIEHAVTEHTVIIPVMNGVDPGERIRKHLKKGLVIDSLIYIIAYANADYSVTQQGNFAKLYLGIQNADFAQKHALKEVSLILSAADIDHKITEDIEQAIWRKYILNCAYNVTTAYYNNSIGQIRSDLEKAGIYETLVHEAWQIALAKRVNITQEHINSIIQKFYHDYADNATSSLQRDICAGKKSELETFSGYLVQEADKYGISIPVTKKLYHELKKKS